MLGEPKLCRELDQFWFKPVKTWNGHVQQIKELRVGNLVLCDKKGKSDDAFEELDLFASQGQTMYVFFWSFLAPFRRLRCAFIYIEALAVSTPNFPGLDILCLPKGHSLGNGSGAKATAFEAERLAPE
eukprot:s48_g8.t1